MSLVTPLSLELCPAAGFTIVGFVIFAPPTLCCTPNPADVLTIRQFDDFDAAMPPVYDDELSFGRIRHAVGDGES